MTPAGWRSTLAAGFLLALIAAARAQDCNRLLLKHIEGQRLKKWVSMHGDVRAGGVALLWGHAPGRAAAALLRAHLLALRYQGVQLRRAPPRLTDLARGQYFNLLGVYDEVEVAVAAAWWGEPDSSCRENARKPGALLGRECGPAGPRLRVLGGGAAPVRLALFARLAPLARCAGGGHWTFYDNQDNLAACNFATSDVNGTKTAVVYYVTDPVFDEITTIEKLSIRAEAASMHLKATSRKSLLSKFDDTRESILFLDFEIWAGEASVRRVEAPPLAPGPDAPVAVRAADTRLDLFEPLLLDAIYRFDPPLESLRRVLRLEAGGLRAEEAACRVAFDSAEPDVAADAEHPALFYVNVQLCLDDPDYDGYDRLLNVLNDEFHRKRLSFEFEVRLRRYKVSNCGDVYEMMDLNRETLESTRKYITLGLVSPGPARGDAALLARQCATASLPLLLYGEATRAALDEGAFSAAGGASVPARALRRLAAHCAWRRLAVVADPAPLAVDLRAALAEGSDFDLHHVAIPFSPTPEDAEAAVRELLAVDARVVLVDAGPAAVAAVLRAARATGATGAKHKWFAREWNPVPELADVRVLTVSYWSRDDERPPRAETLADAALTIKDGYEAIVTRWTHTRYDRHSPEILSMFENTTTVTRPGGARSLRYENRLRADPMVYVDEWRGTERRRLGACGPDACALPAACPAGAPHDGVGECWLRTGPFAPCRDGAAAGVVAALALLVAAAGLARRAMRRHVERRELAVRARLLAGRDRAVSALAGRYLVPRAALELREELGAGRFGRVRLAVLRVPGRTPRTVAAKAPRAGAAPSEEAELLREACALAALEHEHVVRLAGVVADDGPPLVLMEHALFGDLLSYLRARRPLAEAGDTGGEAAHVAAAALTRLAREAAAALGYLALHGMVHRDVRAANCLLDARRSLKLADFGMARETAAGDDGATEYACRRRALFPVLWMAPESLERGVFSAASDVWALGVLLVELVTLGQRPYGAASPLRVLRYVSGGGRPPLPPDATPQTRGACLACWRREARARPSAAQLVAYLAARPRALAPALAPAPGPPPAEPTDADSGFGEPSPDALRTILP